MLMISVTEAIYVLLSMLMRSDQIEAQTQHVPLKRLRQCRQSLERAKAVARLAAVGQEASRRPAVKGSTANTNFAFVALSR